MIKSGRCLHKIACRLFMAVVLCGMAAPAWGDAQFLPGVVPSTVEKPVKLFLEITRSTWKPRGRVLYDIESAIRRKLAHVGFTVVRTVEKTHHFTLHVDYRETRGEPYGMLNFGTVITGMFRLEDQQGRIVCELMIQESAHPSVSGTPPYLDSLDQFQTNPYFYFLGQIFRGAVQGEMDPHVGMLGGVDELVEQDWEQASSDQERFLNPDHSMIPTDNLLASRVLANTIQEFITSDDRAIIPYLLRLLDHSNANVQIHAIQGLQAFQVVEAAVSQLTRLKATTINERVKESIQQAMEDLSGSLSSP